MKNVLQLLKNKHGWALIRARVLNRDSTVITANRVPKKAYVFETLTEYRSSVLVPDAL